MSESPHEPQETSRESSPTGEPPPAPHAQPGGYPPPDGHDPQGGHPGFAPPGQGAPGSGGPGYGPPGYAPPGYGAPGYGQPSPEPYVPGRFGPRPGTDDTNMAMLAHLSGLGNLIAWPLGSVGSLIVYLTRKDQSPYVRDQAAEALNFWITVSIAFVTVTILSTILTFVVIGVAGFLLLPVIWVYALVVGIMGTMAASRGENYRYPLTFRFVT